VFPAPDPQSPAPVPEPSTHRPESPGPDFDPPKPEIKDRLVALFEVLVCSGYPTQLAVGATLAALGYMPFDSTGRLQVVYVVWLSLVDAVLLVGLIVLFLRARGEHPRDVLLGTRPIAGELAYGAPLIVVALAAGIGVLLAIRYLVPWLHTVEQNPLEGLLGSPRDAWLFALVALVGGGIREEIQRAFLLHRFDVWLGGGIVGVVATSAAFGAGHLLQGYDAGIVTALLGALWGVIYLRRRSAVAPMVSHAGFNLLQVLLFVVTRRAA
jgi:membrane protease YdiL (CAAX protease family)